MEILSIYRHTSRTIAKHVITSQEWAYINTSEVIKVTHLLETNHFSFKGESICDIKRVAYIISWSLMHNYHIKIHNQHEKTWIWSKFLFHAIWSLQNMLNIVSIKTYITYGEHATYTFMQDSYHEQATRNIFCFKLN